MTTLLNAPRLLLAAACAWLPLTTAHLLAQHWAAGGPSGYPTGYPWKSIAASADFRRIAVCGWWAPFPVLGAIYTSQDSGTTWTQIPVANAAWAAVVTSADGAKLFAACRWPGTIIASDISGTNWTFTTAPTNSWNCLVCSADGTKIFAGAVGANGDGLIYSSVDAGATWGATGAPSNNWRSVACSADGSFVVAAVDWGNLIYASTNSGATWSTSQAGGIVLDSVACSADGGKLAAVSVDGLIYVSTNSGTVWQPTRSPDDYYGWSAVAAAISADGTTLAAYGTDGDGTFTSITSTDLGVTWAQERSPQLLGFESNARPVPILALSADGNKAALAVSPLEDGSWGGVYTSPYSGPWKRHRGPLNERFRAVASSTDGLNLVAAGLSIYRSADSGTSWIKTSAPSGEWTSLASSSDGTRLVAVETIKGLLYSSTDAGDSWVVTGAPVAGWSSVASSGDGTRLVAAVGATQAAHWTNGAIYVSTNSGTTWTKTSAPNLNWTWVGSSSDGTRLAGLTAEGGIFSSPDSGANWRTTSLPELESSTASAVALSPDGQTLIAAGCCTGTVYASTNLGTTWVPTMPPANRWSSVALSADGTTLIAAAPEGLIFMSKDSGVTWLSTGAPAPLGHRLPVLCSADASRIIAVDDSSDIYTLQLPIAPASPVPPQRLPVLSAASVGSAIRLSWLVPSTTFVLQGNSDLATTNWTDLAVSLELNFTNLHYQVTVSRSTNSRYYRLKQQ